MRQRPLQSAQTGVTLTELTVALAILAILAMFAAPAGLNWWQREQVILLADHFASAASLARATAQRQHVWTHLGPRDARQGWSSGWALHAAASASPGARDIPLSVSAPGMPSLTFAFKSSQPGIDTLSYAPVGYSRTNRGAPLAGTLTIASGAHVRRVRINMAGRARVCDPAREPRSCGLDDADDDS